jgi:hypothetical protein
MFRRKDKPHHELVGAKLDNFLIDFADLYLAKKFKKCVKLAESYLKKYPYDIHVNKNLIDAYSATGNHEKNKVILENAIRHHPKDPTFRLSLSKTYMELSEYTKMVDVLKEGADLGLDFDHVCSEDTFMTSLENAKDMLCEQHPNGQKITEIADALKKEEDNAIHCMKKLGVRGVIVAHQKDHDSVRYALNLLEERRESFIEMNHIKLVRIIDEQVDKIEAIIDSWDDHHSNNAQSLDNQITPEQSLEILKLRLAEGKITKEEFLELKSIMEEN